LRELSSGESKDDPIRSFKQKEGEEGIKRNGKNYEKRTLGRKGVWQDDRLRRQWQKGEETRKRPVGGISSKSTDMFQEGEIIGEKGHRPERGEGIPKGFFKYGQEYGRD